jgi:hypothetical protein
LYRPRPSGAAETALFSTFWRAVQGRSEGSRAERGRCAIARIVLQARPRLMVLERSSRSGKCYRPSGSIPRRREPPQCGHIPGANSSGLERIGERNRAQTSVMKTPSRLYTPPPFDLAIGQWRGEIVAVCAGTLFAFGAYLYQRIWQSG